MARFALDHAAAPATKQALPHVMVLMDYDTFVATQPGATADTATPSATATPETDTATGGRHGESSTANPTAAEFGDGTPLSLDAARRILCDAEIRRVVMDPAGQPVNVGRATRKWSAAQRAAIVARDRHCRWPDCERPESWCVIHHVTWYSRDGETNIRNGVLLCGYHHQQVVHDESKGWTLRIDPLDATVTVIDRHGTTTVSRPPGRVGHRRPTRPRAEAVSYPRSEGHPGPAPRPPEPRRISANRPDGARHTGLTAHGRDVARRGLYTRSWVICHAADEKATHMRLAVFGATGRSGRPLVRLALERGHEVNVLARRPEDLAHLATDDAPLDVVEGDLLDPAAVAKTIGGADAVIDVSGPSRTSPPDLRRRTASALVDAMKQQGVRRVIGVTGAGVRSPDDRPKLIDRVIRGALSLLQRSILEDAEQYVAILRESGLDWTVVRVPRLVDRAPKGRYRVFPGVGPDSGTTLAREDLVRFLLDEAAHPRHLGRVPIVSW